MVVTWTCVISMNPFCPVVTDVNQYSGFQEVTPLKKKLDEFGTFLAKVPSLSICHCSIVNFTKFSCILLTPPTKKRFKVNKYKEWD